MFPLFSWKFTSCMSVCQHLHVIYWCLVQTLKKNWCLMRMILGHTTWVLMDTPTPGSVWCSTTFILQTVSSGHVLGQMWIFNVSRGCSSEFQFNWSFHVIYSLLLKRTCDFSPTCTAQQIPTPPQQGRLVFFFFCVMWSISRLIIPPNMPCVWKKSVPSVEISG